MSQRDSLILETFRGWGGNDGKINNYFSISFELQCISGFWRRLGTMHARESHSVEQAVSVQCSTILKTDAERWETKNKALMALVEIVEQYRSVDDYTRIQEVFGMNIFRLLKEPVKNMIGDLRSQQVRDTCMFLTTLAEVLGDHMRHFLRDSFPYILDGVKVSNKVMSGYVDECIINLMRHTTFKGAIPLLITEISTSKAKIYRERCLDYINEILVCWDIQEKDAELLSEVRFEIALVITISLFVSISQNIFLTYKSNHTPTFSENLLNFVIIYRQSNLDWRTLQFVVEK